MTTIMSTSHPGRGFGAALPAAVFLFAVLSFFPDPGAAAADPLLEPRLHRLADRAALTFPEILPDLAAAHFVYVGEIHDQYLHHQAQVEVVKRLHEAGDDIAVGVESIRQDYQGDLDRWIAGELPEESFAGIYRRNWDDSWMLYRDIFVYCRDHGIPMVALNVAPEITRQVARQGFSSLSPEQASRLPGVSCRVDDIYEQFIRRALGNHGGEGPAFRYFCEAQMVWDTVMAHALLRYLGAHPGKTVVALAGMGHAWKRGIPAQVALKGDFTQRVILPGIPRLLEPETARPGDADYLWPGLTRLPNSR